MPSTIKLSIDMLAELGYSRLTRAQAAELLRALYETLELSVGAVLAEQMSDSQLNAFEKFIDADDEPGALAWLERNFPDYKKMVEERLSALTAALRDAAVEVENQIIPNQSAS